MKGGILFREARHRAMLASALMPARPSLNTLVLVGAPVLSGALSLFLGADFNYDLRHYHFYNGYALAHGRFDHDFAPAGVHSFFNPLQDALYYLGIRHLPARLFGFLLGAVHGLNTALAYGIARAVLAPAPRGDGAAVLLTVLASLGSNALSLLGTTTGDMLVSVPALLALLLALGSGRVRLIGAGAAAGAAAGLKLTMLVPGVALGSALLLTGRARELPRFALGALAGFLATSGCWSWRLLVQLANPLFPFLNGLFRSPFFRPDSVFEPRFVAHAWGEAVSLPVQMALGFTSGLQEIRFRETRFLLVALAALAWLLAIALGRGIAWGRWGAPARTLLAFWLLTYLMWAYGLHYYRYALVPEMLAPLAILVLLRATPFARGPVLAVLVLAALVGSRPVSWGRAPWSDDWFAVTLPPLERIEESLVIVAGERASYVIPYFPPATRFVGLTRRGSPGLDGFVAERLARHPGPLYLLQGVGATPWDAVRFGLRPDGACRRIATRDGGLCLYPLARSGRAHLDHVRFGLVVRFPPRRGTAVLYRSKMNPSLGRNFEAMDPSGMAGSSFRPRYAAKVSWSTARGCCIR